MRQHLVRQGIAARIASMAGVALMGTVGAVCAAPQARHDHHGATPGWHGDITRFHEHDLQRWRGGHWSHDRHAGRFGWWWVVGPAWYYYDTPLYPYPDPWAPIDVLVAPAAPLAPPSAFWYYCTSARTYYPYVARCPGGWTAVPAKPATTPTSPPG